MQGNHSLRICQIEAKKKFYNALRLQSSIYGLYIFLEEHEKVFAKSKHEDILYTLSHWITFFNLLLEQNRKEWEQIEDQLDSVARINSIDQWLELRESLIQPDYWNNFLGQE